MSVLPLSCHVNIVHNLHEIILLFKMPTGIPKTGIPKTVNRSLNDLTTNDPNQSSQLSDYGVIGSVRVN